MVRKRADELMRENANIKDFDAAYAQAAHEFGVAPAAGGYEPRAKAGSDKPNARIVKTQAELAEQNQAANGLRDLLRKGTGFSPEDRARAQGYSKVLRNAGYEVPEKPLDFRELTASSLGAVQAAQEGALTKNAYLEEHGKGTGGGDPDTEAP
jgi:hypothetical protein